MADEKSYQSWRKKKLSDSSAHNGAAIVSIENPFELSESEKNALLSECKRNNYVIYQLLDEGISGKDLVHALGHQLGLNRLDTNLRADDDSVTSIEVTQQSGNQYIPYTDKPLSWHSDGYYNTSDRQIRGIIMHCVTPAEAGGENEIIDHEMLYIKLRDEDPAWIKALMSPDALTIPANVEEGVEIRAEQSGPVFSVDVASGHLHMRYSARKRNIQWKNDDITLQAADKITELLNDSSIIFRHKFTAGQGIVCNNILHNRTRFEDSKENRRLIYRARYYDRVKAVTEC